MHAAGTIGTGPPAVGKPWPRSARYRMTPSAAASPNADPPAKHDRVDARDGARGIEQIDLARRRRAAAHLARTDRARREQHTVTPVPSRVTCPTRTPRSRSSTRANRRARAELRSARRAPRGRSRRSTGRAPRCVRASACARRRASARAARPGIRLGHAPRLERRRQHVGGAADDERRDPHVRAARR